MLGKTLTILRKIPIHGQTGTAYQFTFPVVHYFPVTKTSLTSVQIRLLNESGEAPNLSTEVSLTLHLKRVSK